MFRPLVPLCVPCLVLAGSLMGQAPTAKPAVEDHSKEAFVLEQFSQKEKFEDDGTSTREDTARVRIQSDAGVRRYGLLTFSYSSGTGTFEIV